MLLMAAFTMMSFTSSAQAAVKSNSTVIKQEKNHQSYCCSMHPGVISEKAGKCPQCGRDLLRTPKEKMKMEVMKTYTCPMHPSQLSHKPGKCSQCGMVMNASPKEKMKMEVMKMYSCPMHADVVSAKPGTCSKCGMTLNKTKSERN